MVRTTSSNEVRECLGSGVKRDRGSGTSIRPSRSLSGSSGTIDLNPTRRTVWRAFLFQQLLHVVSHDRWSGRKGSGGAFTGSDPTAIENQGMAHQAHSRSSIAGAQLQDAPVFPL